MREILIAVALVIAVLIFLGCLAVFAVLARKEVRVERTVVVAAERSPEWVRLNAELDRDVIDEKAYREAFDAWAESVGLGKS